MITILGVILGLALVVSYTYLVYVLARADFIGCLLDIWHRKF